MKVKLVLVLINVAICDPTIILISVIAMIVIAITVPNKRTH